MISNLLVMDPKKRMDATKALKHVWLSKEFKLSDRKPEQTTADAVQDNLMNYKDVHALKKIALNVSFLTLFPFRFTHVANFTIVAGRSGYCAQIKY